MRLTKFSVIALLASVAGAATAAPPSSNAGEVVVDAAGRTLYFYAKDLPNKSRCVDACAKAWPPFLVESVWQGNANFRAIRRPDGTDQWAYRGYPLYYFNGDKAPGDAKGNGVGKAWSVLATDVKQVPPND